ncbi:MAG: GNAT family N-acetyltransferase [Bacillota bacterium]|nr:GNAT family N-acetyltransferase [Bacillota bacterium]
MIDNESLIIRQIHEQDTERLYAYFSSFSDETRYFFTPHELGMAFAEKLTHADLVDPETRRFVVVTQQDGQETIIGYFFFWSWQKKVPWFGIGVRDGYKGRGLGSLMMQHAIREAKQQGKGGILLTTKKDNARAQKLYRKFGFVILGDEPRGEYLLLLNFSDEKT